ncbi:similar to Saccharomyces cerevisiae YJL172W CPS1 Vacuolar carboxypeptidase yscS [Maudiozyma saulgeensis]|uniref:Similar to Saccharomyces cerevisiae YJL172W CPS1 Vacuolar carboxypeptidase yscS n=1 Tax=Maudiozyma saulgeensis TaxID=1789683 RepID=A0A1X7QXL9_9SACH|nr:similar to Saccharomyces cerevisiae YJL172W CPS1 Vacuolar carboxypeptidase yscS [Kazachstania saulgeensis]
MPKIPTNPNNNSNKVLRTLLTCLVAIFLLLIVNERYIWNPLSYSIKEEHCPASLPIHASDDMSVQHILHDPKYKQQSIKRLTGAIQIPTVIYDDNPEPNESPEYYKEWYNFHNYLVEQFPLVHKYLKRETVKNVSLLYTWQGSNPILKPIIFSAHIDVVPVESSTVQQWEHPPFSGHYDKESDTIWGRGSFDSKNLLIAQLEAIEYLLSLGNFTTERTILLSYGHDEETGGRQGAVSISKLLLNRYGPKGILALFDEGAGVIPLKDKKTFVAAILNSEKGYVDLAVKFSGSGPGRTGHSSQPPDHTHIGVASELLKSIEKYPFKSNFKITNPTFEFLSCAAEHSLGLPKYLQWLIRSARHNRLAEYTLGRLLDMQGDYKYYFRTSQAIDVIQGGNKANALPEYVTFTINHRIEIESSVNETISHFISLAKKVASKYHYSILLDGKTIINVPPQQNIAPATIDIHPIGSLEPSPITPAEGDLWDILTGTVQYIFEDSMGKAEEPNLFMSPALSPGNTDSKHFWDVTDNIYRFIGSIVPADILDTAHSVNEHFVMNYHLQAIAFVHQFIVNINEFGRNL